MIDQLTSYELPWTGDEGYKKAEVTGGSVALDEVDPRTLESRRTPASTSVASSSTPSGRSADTISRGPSRPGGSRVREPLGLTPRLSLVRFQSAKRSGANSSCSFR